MSESAVNYLSSIKDVYEVPTGMALEIFNDKYARVKELVPNPDHDPSHPESRAKVPVHQSWGERLDDVVRGNFSLERRTDLVGAEFEETLKLGQQGVMAYSGRHLQHGDKDQASKSGELFTNCSTAMFSWAQFLLLMKGSGVGRDYTSDICWTDWDFLPSCRFVLEAPDAFGNGGHPDYEPWIESLQEARHKYDSESEKVRWFEVDDSAEGWVRILTIMETAAFHKNNRDHLFIFNMTPIRCKGTPIKGQQNRPASGPVPLIRALAQVCLLKGVGMKPWEQALRIDDYMASCVAVGGVRRAARMATKHWRDRDVIRFADIKREGFLRSANNSILVDQEFWNYVKSPTNRAPDAVHARRVFTAATEAALLDGSGEPGFINVDLLTWLNDGMETITPETYIHKDYADTILDLHPKTRSMLAYFLEKAKKKTYNCIVNPCGEIVLALYGGYCVIGDICGLYCRTKEDFLRACWLMARCLIRTNLMKSMYKAEVDRTNRIGVGVIGLYEFAYLHFDLDVHEILWADKEVHNVIGDDCVVDLKTRKTLPKDTYRRSLEFAAFLDNARETVRVSAEVYCAQRGLTVPHTMMTAKPAGTVSKVLVSTEAANAPNRVSYLRNVQFPLDNPRYAELKALGYPSKDIGHQYAGHGVIGFPTKQPIIDIMGDRAVCVTDMSPTEQFEWLRFLERHWLGGPGQNNQISYTMKYVENSMDLTEFQQLLVAHQSTVKCCSWMGMSDTETLKRKYAYLPEEPITAAEFVAIQSRIDSRAVPEIEELKTDRYSDDALQCDAGVCPIERTQMVFTDGSAVTEADLMVAVGSD